MQSVGTHNAISYTGLEEAQRLQWFWPLHRFAILLKAHMLAFASLLKPYMWAFALFWHSGCGFGCGHYVPLH